jgi:hypothetical protein
MDYDCACDALAEPGDLDRSAAVVAIRIGSAE